MSKRQKEPEIPAFIPMTEQFANFSKYGDTKSDGKTISLSQSDKWMKQAGLLGKKITTTDTGICFNKFKTRSITFQNYEKFLHDLAKLKQLEFDDIIGKMTSCGYPGFPPAEQPDPNEIDTSKYKKY